MSSRFALTGALVVMLALDGCDRDQDISVTRSAATVDYRSLLSWYLDPRALFPFPPAFEVRHIGVVTGGIADDSPAALRVPVAIVAIPNSHSAMMVTHEGLLVLGSPSPYAPPPKALKPPEPAWLAIGTPILKMGVSAPTSLVGPVPMREGQGYVVASDTASFVETGDVFSQTRVASTIDKPVRDTTLGDFDGDGKLDLAVLATDGFVGIARARGDGGFNTPALWQQNPGPFPFTGLPQSPRNKIVAADFNGDGKLDLAASATWEVSVFLGKGDGTTQAGQPVTAYDYVSATGIANPSRMVARDFNRDKIMDLAVMSTVGRVGIFYGAGDGITFGNPSIQAITSNGWLIELRDMVGGDFNGDGTTDLAVTLTNQLVVLSTTRRGKLWLPVWANPPVNLLDDPQYYFWRPGPISAAQMFGSGMDDLAVVDALPTMSRAHVFYFVRSL